MSYRYFQRTSWSSSSTQDKEKGWEESATSSTTDSSTSDAEEWIRPDRPLSGDKGHSHMYELKSLDASSPPATVEGDVDDESEMTPETASLDSETTGEVSTTEQEVSAAPSIFPPAEEPIDWLATRRAKQQHQQQQQGNKSRSHDDDDEDEDDQDDDDAMSGEMYRPVEGRIRRRDQTDLPVIKHTLLSFQEIASVVKSLGGRDVLLMVDKDKRMGGIIGMILVTATTSSHARLLASTLVRQLQRRDLAEMGVVGAKSGAEGSSDDALSDDWIVVDCQNYAVHIQLEETRRHVDLEKLWSGNDDLFKVNLQNEQEVDDYIAANPVPEGYGSEALARVDFSNTLSSLKKNRFNEPPAAVRVRGGRRKGRKRPRR